ncbi:hypothetical protein [Streptomyces sp. NPDC127066]|uniref:hypothetical protein n=1 Tax=Streptomyces sp. NPDC127066 TaxID=3347125 RepID=UPI0036561D0E
MAVGLGLESLQVGDLVKVSLVMTPARVTSVDRHFAYVEWPWGGIDPESRFRWDGNRAFARDPHAEDWLCSPYRTDPEPRHLAENDMCVVGIPEMVTRVVGIDRYEQPQDEGFLPRFLVAVSVLPVDGFAFIDGEDAGDTLYFPSAEPITIERVAD